MIRFLWRQLNSRQQDQVYFFSSHFFTQLNGSPDNSQLTASERFARVSRWTQREMGLFEKRFLFFPKQENVFVSLHLGQCFVCI